jgi:Mu transposase-like protein
MLALPPVPPVVQSVPSVRLGRDYYVRVAGNDYHVDPGAIDQLVDVTTTLAQVTLTRSGCRPAVHDRYWAARQALTDPAHVQAAAAGGSSKPPHHRRQVIIWCGTWPTMTGRSVSTSGLAQSLLMARWHEHGRGSDEGRPALRPGSQGAAHP